MCESWGGQVMNAPAPKMHAVAAPQRDLGLECLCAVAAYFRIPATRAQLARELSLNGEPASLRDIVRAAKFIDLRARIIERATPKRLATLPTPALVRLKDGGFRIYTGRTPRGAYRIVDALTKSDQTLSLEDLHAAIDGNVILIARRIGGAGADPGLFTFRWFLPSIWRYRKPIAHVLIASLFVQIFALVTPLFFQVVVDKVISHKGYSTLFVLVAGMALIGLFDVTLQYLRTYALAHTTSRIDVELGARLFGHLLKLPLGYFEMRAAGQTVARVRELETIRAFLTGQALFSVIDLAFAFIFIAVMFHYSATLTLIVVATIPIYVAIGVLVRPLLRARVQEKFNRGAISQQFLVEAVVGIQTIKAGAVEPAMRAQWEDRLASYVRTAFETTLLGAGAQGAIQYVNKATVALLLLFGAKAVIDGDMTVGALVAFNMISSQAIQPILRLSQLAQDFQQIQVSVERLGDILNHPIEPEPKSRVQLPPPRGAIEFRNVSFSYRPGGQEVLHRISLQIRPGEVIGIVGPSGSGKSTVTKLIQRLYAPNEGQVLLDGADLGHVDPAWLRSQIGVVLQENLLFHRSIHDNIAFANPGMPRQQVMAVARLAGADEFIGKMAMGYDTMIEERGGNLSGGQRQRIAIARALATNPSILIFDEATSALDYESERIIQRNMRQIVQNRTVIIIAHRLAAVRGCQRILGMVDGRIVEQGPHSELVTRPNGLYARLWALQSATAEELA